MGEKSAIAWTDATWNPVTGCTKVSPGCKNCYAEPMAKRLKRMVPEKKYRNEFKITCHPESLNEPLKWKKPQKIFVCSMGDLFHEDVPDSFLIDVFNVMAEAKHHTFQVLTKRPERMLDFILGTSGAGANNEPLPNVWLGVTAENQEQADKRIPLLLQTPAAVRFVSIEPMLGGIEVINGKANRWSVPTQADSEGRGIEWTDPGEKYLPLDWVIVGGESGPGARPMHPDWVRSLRDQCKAAGVPFFFKQWGEWITEEIEGNSFELKDLKHNQQIGKGMKAHTMSLYTRVGKAKAGSLLDGKEYKEVPK